MPDKLSEAREHHRAGRLGQAYDLYRHVMATEPDNLEALFHYGHLVRQSGQTEAARDIFLHAISLAPRQGILFASLGEVQKELGRNDEAIKAFERAIKLDAEDFTAHINIGLCHQAEGRLQSAVTYLHMADVIKPDFAPTLINLGIALYRLGDTEDEPEKIDEAIGALARAAEIDADNPAAVANLAVACHKQRKFAAAVEAAGRAIKLDPKHLIAQDMLSSSLIAMRDFDRAREVLETAVANHPDNDRFWQKLAGICYQADRYEKAIQAFKQVTRLRPDEARHFVALATICNEVSQFEDAAAAYARAIELGVRSPRIYLGLGQALARLDRLDEARAALERGLALDPENVSMRFAVAALSDDKIDAAPEAYVAELFDDFAERFDEHLLDALEYRTPELLSVAVHKVLEGGEAKLNVVDLGCGTGLCGPLFRDIADRLVGTDLSAKMIGKAREREIYDELRTESLADTLAAADGNIDLAIAADVFVYIGDLDPVFAAAASALRHGGLFAFSIEITESEGFSVGTTFRFAHSHGYVKNLARKHGFKVLADDAAVIRRESGQPVEGGIYVLRRR